MTTCPNCAAANDPAARFCTSCGTALQRETEYANIPPPPQRPRLAAPTRVVISGLDIPFGDLVAILIKLALASIPATVILLLIGTLFAAFLGAAIAGLVESFGAP